MYPYFFALSRFIFCCLAVSIQRSGFLFIKYIHHVISYILFCHGCKQKLPMPPFVYRNIPAIVIIKVFFIDDDDDDDDDDDGCNNDDMVIVIARYMYFI